MRHIIWSIAAFVILTVMWGCRKSVDSHVEIIEFTGPAPAETENVVYKDAHNDTAHTSVPSDAGIDAKAAKGGESHSDTALEPDTVSPYNSPLPDMPEPTIALKVRNIGRYAEIFNDSNHIHWAEAEKIGIEPLGDTRSHWILRRPLVKVTPCRDFFVEPLTYSRPYLIPEAAALLHEIGSRFRDSLESRGGGDYRIKVTSVLRTPESVSRLRRRNSNALDSSVHQLGTTFDVSYSRFIADSDRIPRSAEDLKGILAEVLLSLRNEGRCWVKYEIKQPCFHITVRKQ